MTARKTTRRQRGIVGTSLFVLCCSAHALAEVRHVPKAYPTIQSAIEACAAGDIVEVAPGLYEEGLVLGGRSITLRSTEGAAATIVDPVGGRCLTSIGQIGDAAHIEDFTFRGGIATRGGGVVIESSSPVLSNCVISGNSTDGTACANGGAGVYVQSGDPRFVDCIISANTVLYGRGGGVRVFSGSQLLEDCLIVENSVLGSCSSAGGGGIYSSAPLRFSSCTIELNVAGWSGGGWCKKGGESWLENSDVRNNTSSTVGGVWQPSGGLSVLNTLFCGNGVNISGSYTNLGGNQLNGQCAPFCMGDANGDTYINAEDLSEVLADWGDCVTSPCYSDFNGDGVVGAQDLSQVLSNWGRCPGW